jgi:hypothetical protein
MALLMMLLALVVAVVALYGLRIMILSLDQVTTPSIVEQTPQHLHARSNMTSNR